MQQLIVLRREFRLPELTLKFNGRSIDFLDREPHIAHIHIFRCAIYLSTALLREPSPAKTSVAMQAMHSPTFTVKYFIANTNGVTFEFISVKRIVCRHETPLHFTVEEAALQLATHRIGGRVQIVN